MTKEEARKMYDSKWWLDKEARDICLFQLFEERLCMPFAEFQQAMEKALNRPVYTHEFNLDWGLKKELLGEKEPPTLTQIINLIPEVKRIIMI